jgi:hypothetical protein
MKSIFYAVLGAFFLILWSSTQTNAQSNYEDVVYLKSGSVVRGVIIEQIPNETIKIQTADRNIFVYNMGDVIKITKEPIPTQSQTEDVSAKKEISTVNGKDFFMDNKYLLKEEVEVFIRDSKNGMAYQFWVSGQRNLKTSRTLIWTGTPLTLLGTAAAIGFIIDNALPPFIIMLIATPIGIGVTASGVFLNVSGKNKIIQGVNFYNSSINASAKQSKLQLSIEPALAMPGVSIKLRF